MGRSEASRHGYELKIEKRVGGGGVRKRKGISAVAIKPPCRASRCLT